jgi:hypothetical protein
MMSRHCQILLASITALILGGIGACSAPDNFHYDTCDPKIISLADPWCRDVDAGPDAESDAGPDGASLRPDDACLDKGGECVPKPSDSNAYKWEGPAPVWIGPASEKPTECPFDGVIVAEKYAGLHAPPLDCAPCECEEPTALCAGVPGSISVGTTACTNGGISVPFDGPGGWDGKCTSANAIPAGAQCPPGSGTPCVQSIAWSALPGPQNEACQVKTNTVPKFNGATTSWKMAAVACDWSLSEDLCGNGKQTCSPDPRFPWAQCVWLDGLHENECPDDYAYSAHVLYDHEPIDSRTCTACSCGTPTGGACVANFAIFGDSECSTGIQNQTVSSVMPDCNLVFPAGLAIGSKSITEHLYVPGTCAAGGGEPIGEAVEDKTQATTFCCRMSKIFVE